MAHHVPLERSRRLEKMKVEYPFCEMLRAKVSQISFLEFQ
jgi:hypothetical protein